MHKQTIKKTCPDSIQLKRATHYHKNGEHHKHGQ